MYIIRGNVYEHPDPSIDGFKEDDSKTTLISKIFNLTKFPSDYELIINELFLDFVLVFIENTYLLKIQYFGFSFSAQFLISKIEFPISFLSHTSSRIASQT